MTRYELREQIINEFKDNNKDHVSFPWYKERLRYFEEYVDLLLGAFDAFTAEASDDTELREAMLPLWNGFQDLWDKVFKYNMKHLSDDDFEEAFLKAYPITIYKGTYGIEVRFDYKLPHQKQTDKDILPKAYRKALIISFNTALNKSDIDPTNSMIDKAFLVYEHHFDKEDHIPRDTDNYSRRDETNAISQHFCTGGDSPYYLQQVLISVPDDKYFTIAKLIPIGKINEYLSTINL